MRGPPEVVSEWRTALLCMYVAEDLLSSTEGAQASRRCFRCYPDNDFENLLFVQDKSKLTMPASIKELRFEA